MANSHKVATTEDRRTDAGGTRSNGSPRACQALDRTTAGKEPGAGADKAKEGPKATRSPGKAVSRGRVVRVNSHSGSESTSTCAPRLKTRPCPAKRLSMIRKLMNASSSTHRYTQAPTSTMTTGTTTGHHRKTEGAGFLLSSGRPSWRSAPVPPRRRIQPRSRRTPLGQTNGSAHSAASGGSSAGSLTGGIDL